MDWLTFEGVVEPMQWGDNTYTILRLPDDIARALGVQGAKRVEGELAEHPVNLALTKAPPVDGVFLYAGKSLLDRIGIVPGERFEARLRPADETKVNTPPDVSSALRAAGTLADWNALSPGKRRGHLHQIEMAKREETRTKRIAALAAALKGAS